MPRVKKETKEQTPKILKEDPIESLIPERVINRSKPLVLFKYLPWILIVVVLLLSGLFVLKQKMKTAILKQELIELKQNPEKIAEAETNALIEKVGQLIELPNEQPTIATVTDLEALKGQAFFEKAQLGDKVLIYTGAKKAFLYRPSTNKVIEVAPVNIDSDSGASNSNKSTNSNKNSSPSTANSNLNSSLDSE